jgi:O-glycosyl hydrolase
MNRSDKTRIALFTLWAWTIVCGGMDAAAATGKVKAGETHQTMVGFGASIAYHEERLTGHPNKNEIYDFIFNDLGLDVLRLRLQFIDNRITNPDAVSEIVKTMFARSSYRPVVFMSSWSPPYNLKSNNSQKGLGTLKKSGGKYVYGPFGRYWADALKAYKAIGVEPDYISFQNEPSYGTTAWETCYLDELKQLTQNKVALLGNIPPLDVLARGDAAKASQAASELLDSLKDKTKVIFSCGGGMPPGVSTENITAFIRTVRACSGA